MRKETIQDSPDSPLKMQCKYNSPTKQKRTVFLPPEKQTKKLTLPKYMALLKQIIQHTPWNKTQINFTHTNINTRVTLPGLINIPGMNITLPRDILSIPMLETIRMRILIGRIRKIQVVGTCFVTLKRDTLEVETR